MPQGDHNRIATVAEAVRDAAAIVDPGDGDDAVTVLQEIYEDDDRPATAVEDLAGDLIATARGIDPEGDDGAVLAAAAATAWLAVNPHDQHEDHQGDHVLREGVRLAFGKDVPPQLRAFLESRGVRL
jgi:hypothetical protein